MKIKEPNKGNHSDVNTDIQKMKSESASDLGVKDFEDIDRGQLTSRANGDITRALMELAERKLDDGGKMTKK